jgi:Pectate lyase superfamily protein
MTRTPASVAPLATPPGGACRQSVERYPSRIGRKSNRATLGAALVFFCILASPVAAPGQAVQGTAIFEHTAFINVRAYKALGDGVTNDAPAIQNAINACPAPTSTAGSGCIVYFPSSATYAIASGLTVASATPHAGGIKLLGECGATQGTPTSGNTYSFSWIAVG